MEGKLHALDVWSRCPEGLRSEISAFRSLSLLYLAVCRYLTEHRYLMMSMTLTRPSICCVQVILVTANCHGRRGRVARLMPRLGGMLNFNQDTSCLAFIHPHYLNTLCNPTSTIPDSPHNQNSTTMTQSSKQAKLLNSLSCRFYAAITQYIKATQPSIIGAKGLVQRANVCRFTATCSQEYSW